MPVNLYGASLFAKAYKSVVLKGLNNAPGGDGGVDVDVQHRLGAPGSATMKDRRHGICCGIVVAWMVGFCNKREDAVNTTGFEAYFKNVLRFQGAYMKDFKGDVTSIDQLDGIHPHGLSRTGSGQCSIDALSGLFPTGVTWAGYLSVWRHAIGIGINEGGVFSGERYLIMDPNGGLFKYKNKADFIDDLKQLCNARRIKNGAAGDAKISYTFFKKA